MPEEKKRLEGYLDRVNQAFALWKLRGLPRRLTQEDLAEAVTKITGEHAGQNSASRWLAGSIPRDFDTMVALPLALGVDPGWLYFGPDSAASAPAALDSLKEQSATHAPIRDARGKAMFRNPEIAEEIEKVREVEARTRGKHSKRKKA